MVERCDHCKFLRSYKKYWEHCKQCHFEDDIAQLWTKEKFMDKLTMDKRVLRNYEQRKNGAELKCSHNTVKILVEMCQFTGIPE